METAYREQLPEDFSADSRVWIYQSSRLFFLSEALEIEAQLENFVASWKSHGATVKGYANLFFGQFIVLMADERQAGVSGCSTDESVRLIKGFENTFKVQLFDRQSLAFLVKDKVQLIPMNQLAYAVENGFINGDTLYFNNTVANRKELDEQWIIPLKQSWLTKRLPSLITG